ncbi:MULTISPECIES: hypothetical protein [unclassified Pseudomonas]|uniref:hypothetical protein n=1 Tax=unclassified Pseudomonas TaxID=196821 RepID=UPI00249AC7A3|nr:MULTISPECIES: hypothetical protein [unclassified Pseudomonas]MDI3249333.1 hypothetical protein [Pseudomonas sp. AL10]MDI3265143.1 hypothetical protein [Pseudomonas sp. AL15]
MFEDINIQVRTAASTSEHLQSLFKGQLESQDLLSLFSEIAKNLLMFEEHFNAGHMEDALKPAKMISIYGQQLAAKVQGIPNDIIRNTGKLLDIDCESLQEAIKNRSSSTDHVYNDDRIKKLLNENAVRIAELEIRIQRLEHEAQDEINKVLALYTDGIEAIESSKSEINDILGHVSGRAIAGDYEKSATDEKVMADWLRYGALACMALIVVVLGSAVAATITNEFEWPRFLSRVSLVFLLSVPAAYLARESAKHREQQYQHQQTSLDMKAVSPFLASLPEDERHKIKAAIASRIFSGKDFSKAGSDPYPINTHEILMELIKKLEVSTKPTDSKNSTSI